MRERLLAKARELIADRLEQAQVRRGDGVVVRNLGDRNTISIEPELLGSPDTLARRRYYAGELVVVGNSVRVAPFVVPTYDACGFGSEGSQPVAEFDPDFPFMIPTIGGVPLDSVTPPTLATASSGVAYLRATYNWGQTPGTSEEDPAGIFYYLDNVQVVAYPIGTEPPYSVQTAYLDRTESGDESYVLSSSFSLAHHMIGWWEFGRRPMQGGFLDPVEFGVPLANSTTSVNMGRRINAPSPIAYVNVTTLL